VSRPPLTCQELVELVTDYLEGRLPVPDRARFEEHLAACEGCTAYVEQMRALVEALGALPEPVVPPELEADLLAAFRDWRGGGP
jgi:anti-sigma factor RsiW